MTIPLDNCRLYIHLRDLAYTEPDADPGGGRLGVIDVDDTFDDPEVGLDHEHAAEALDALLHAHLVRHLTAAELDICGVHPDAGHEALYVEATDDLGAATMLFPQN